MNRIHTAMSADKKPPYPDEPQGDTPENPTRKDQAHARRAGKKPEQRPRIKIEHLAITEEDLASFDQRIPGIADVLRGYAAKALEEAEAARTDSLTQIPNRLGLEDKMGWIVQQMKGLDKRDPDKGKACTMVFIDTNDFGQINKAINFATGNCAIQAVADFFRQTLRTEDVIARQGGDEFVIAMRCPEDEARQRLHGLKGEFKREATRIFYEKLVALMRSQHKDLSDTEIKQQVKQKLGAFQDALAAKYGNDALKQQPFSLSFSFGTHPITEKELAEIDPNSPDSISGALERLMIHADDLMRSDKEAYRKTMTEYTMPHHRIPAAKQKLVDEVSRNDDQTPG